MGLAPLTPCPLPQLLLRLPQLSSWLPPLWLPQPLPTLPPQPSEPMLPLLLLPQPLLPQPSPQLWSTPASQSPTPTTCQWPGPMLRPSPLASRPASSLAQLSPELASPAQSWAPQLSLRLPQLPRSPWSRNRLRLILALSHEFGHSAFRPCHEKPRKIHPFEKKKNPFKKKKKKKKKKK